MTRRLHGMWVVSEPGVVDEVISRDSGLPSAENLREMGVRG